MSIIANYQQEQKIREIPVSSFTLAKVGTRYDDGVSLIFPGSEAESQKHYKCNQDSTFAAGDLVYIVKDSGTYIVICKIGNPK